MWRTIRQLSNRSCLLLHPKLDSPLSLYKPPDTSQPLEGLCFAKAAREDSCMFDTSDTCCTCPATSSDPHSTLLWLSLWLLLVPGLITSHFPTINCINHLPACNPDKSKSFWMSLFCSSAPPNSSALFYVISIFQALLKLHSVWGHCSHFNSNPSAHQCFNSLLIYLYCLLSEPNSINKSWNSNTCTRLNYTYKHSSGDTRQLLWSRWFL